MLWSAAENEERNGPIGNEWETVDKERYAAALTAVAGPEFEKARAEGSSIPLDEAVEYALAGRKEPVGESGEVRP